MAVSAGYTVDQPENCGALEYRVDDAEQPDSSFRQTHHLAV